MGPRRALGPAEPRWQTRAFGRRVTKLRSPRPPWRLPTNQSRCCRLSIWARRKIRSISPTGCRGNSSICWRRFQSYGCRRGLRRSTSRASKRPLPSRQSAQRGTRVGRKRSQIGQSSAHHRPARPRGQQLSLVARNLAYYVSRDQCGIRLQIVSGSTSRAVANRITSEIRTPSTLATVPRDHPSFRASASCEMSASRRVACHTVLTDDSNTRAEGCSFDVPRFSKAGVLLLSSCYARFTLFYPLLWANRLISRVYNTLNAMLVMFVVNRLQR